MATARRTATAKASMTFCFFLTAAPLALVEGALCSLIVCTSNDVNNRGLAWA